MKHGAATPWGRADHVKRIGEINGYAIYQVSTPSHGGDYVPSELLNAIPLAMQARAAKWSGSAHWYEEDCEWASVAVSFPTLFSPEALNHAQQTIEWRKREAGALV